MMVVCGMTSRALSCNVEQSWAVACFQGYLKIADAEDDTQNANRMQTCPESKIFPSFCSLGNQFGYRNRLSLI